MPFTNPIDSCFPRHAQIWYAHQLTSVYFVRGGEVGGLTYFDKGWTSFEYCIALLIKPPNRAQFKDWPMLLDLGSTDAETGLVARPRQPQPLPSPPVASTSKLSSCREGLAWLHANCLLAACCLDASS